MARSLLTGPASLPPHYAPQLKLIGVAEGGIPVDYAHNLTYINGSSGWSGIIPATLVALTRAFHVNLAPYLSTYGRKLVAQVQAACIGSFYGAYPGLTVEQLVKPKYRSVLRVPAFVRIVNELIIGQRRPDTPPARSSWLWATPMALATESWSPLTSKRWRTNTVLRASR